MNILAPLRCDAYKTGHIFQYDPSTTLIYSNLTPRKSRVNNAEGVVNFGFQYYVMAILLNYWDENFFLLPKDEVIKAYKRRIDNYLGPGMSVQHIADLHDVGFLPLHVKALPEGTVSPFRVPVLTIRNTKPEFFWLTNMVETDLSNTLWQALTSATTAFGYRKVFEAFAKKTGAPRAFVPWQGHDFSYRGLTSLDSAALSGAAHLLSFTGTDTIPAIDLLEQYYGADCEKELIGGSVPATEHSVMCMGLKEGELALFKRLITEVYPANIVSIVSDTWDFWKVLTEYLPALKTEVLARNGKVVIRPDSGDPVNIICGDPKGFTEPEQKGAIRCLYEVFGGTRTATGYLELDPHIGLIYGDSITPERQREILERLAANGFASSNVVLGIGSYTYQYVTRDTFGFAMKATYGETISGGSQPIYKDPKTDDGTKKSAYGLLKVDGPDEECSEIHCHENVTWKAEGQGLLHNIFIDGSAYNFQTLAQIRARLEAQL